MFCNEPWNNAKDLYAKTLADFAKHCISHQWVSVEERLPEPHEEVLTYTVNAIDENAVAYCAGEDWYTTDGEHIRPSRWMEIPPLIPEN